MYDNPNVNQPPAIIQSIQDIGSDWANQNQIEAERQAKLDAELANRTQTSQQGGYGSGGYGNGSY
jgi:hypothetical protein